MLFFFFFQAEDGIRDAQESRGLGDVYKRQVQTAEVNPAAIVRRRSVASERVASSGADPADVTEVMALLAPVSYTHLTLPTIYSV